MVNLGNIPAGDSAVLGYVAGEPIRPGQLVTVKLRDNCDDCDMGVIQPVGSQVATVHVTGHNHEPGQFLNIDANYPPQVTSRVVEWTNGSNEPASRETEVTFRLRNGGSTATTSSLAPGRLLDWHATHATTTTSETDGTLGFKWFVENNVSNPGACVWYDPGIRGGEFIPMTGPSRTATYTWTAMGSHEASEEEREELAQRYEQKKKAEKQADKLLKKWLSTAEYNYLQENGELELPSKYEQDTIYIVKKSYGEKVIKKVAGVPTVALCVMPLSSSYVNDDSLLSKILLLKTDEKQFLSLANHYPLLEARHA
jgi:hypothetical protein